MNKGKLQRMKNEEHDRLTDVILDTLTSECDIERSTRAPNGAGGYAETYSVVPTLRCIKCAINQFRPGMERLEVEQPGIAIEYVVHLPPETDIRQTDRIVIGDNRYEVVSNPQPVSIEVARRVYVVSVQ